MSLLSSEISTSQAAHDVDQPAGSGPGADAPMAIEVRGLNKTFRIPEHRIDTFKERAVHPFAKVDFHELKVLRDVSFDVRKGEFFGIVGRNGSGKSTLLKILASIYKADAGRIRMAGRIAPFIELGVGFNTELPARENIILNGVMMGLSRREAQARLDAVLDFAELRDFADLKLKNYSSGMTVRLAFSVMIQADADVMLIDEVLAVGDAAFQQKCADTFHRLRAEGKTIALVTHDMSSVQTYCHRAMLLHDGKIAYAGDPEEVGRRYLRLNFASDSALQGSGGEALVPDLHARVVDSWLEDESGARLTNVESGVPLRLETVIEASRDLVNPIFGFHCYDAEGVHVFGFNHRMSESDGPPGTLAAGERIRISCNIENVLASGRYFLRCWVARDRRIGDMALQLLDLLGFVVYDVDPSPGIVAVKSEVHSSIERGPGS